MDGSSVYSGKKVLVVGLGLSGRSAASFLIHHGGYVCGIDRNVGQLAAHPEMQSLLQNGCTICAEAECPSVENFDLVVLSPGIPSTHPIVEAALRQGKPVIGEVELGCRTAQNPMLGITGTNGKTTATLLAAHVLNTCGLKAHALGNVGVPFTQELLIIPPADRIVLELSSYQLETLSQRSLDAAVLLNITPDHLDRYGSMEAYAAAKCRIERCLKPHAPLYVEEQTWKTYGHLFKESDPFLYGYSKDATITTDLTAVYHDKERVFELPQELRGRPSHDLENALAIYALCASQGISGQDFIQAWATFKKPPHRIEFVAEHQGIKFYDDSKGTNLDAVIRAVQSLEGPIVLIAGGVDKGASYSPWIEAFQSKVKHICAIGQAAGKIQAELSSDIPVALFTNLEEAVLEATRMAQRGETVLLSPGCASFDMFKDYAERGHAFQRIVKQWIKDSKDRCFYSNS